jgi:hypothetical protein
VSVYPNTLHPDKQKGAVCATIRPKDGNLGGTGFQAPPSGVTSAINSKRNGKPPTETACHDKVQHFDTELIGDQGSEKGRSCLGRGPTRKCADQYKHGLEARLDSNLSAKISDALTGRFRDDEIALHVARSVTKTLVPCDPGLVISETPVDDSSIGLPSIDHAGTNRWSNLRRSD